MTVSAAILAIDAAADHRWWQLIAWGIGTGLVGVMFTHSIGEWRRSSRRH